MLRKDIEGIKAFCIYLLGCLAPFILVITPTVIASSYWIDRFLSDQIVTKKRIYELAIEHNALSERLQMKDLAPWGKRTDELIEAQGYSIYLLERDLDAAGAAHRKINESGRRSNMSDQERAAFHADLQRASNEYSAIKAKTDAIGPMFRELAAAERKQFWDNNQSFRALRPDTKIPDFPPEYYQLKDHLASLTTMQLWKTKLISSLFPALAFCPALYLVDLALTRRDKKFRILNAHSFGMLIVTGVFIFVLTFIWAATLGLYESLTVFSVLSFVSAGIAYLGLLDSTESRNKYYSLIAEPENERQRQLAKEREEARIRAEQQKERDRQYAIVRADREKQEAERRQAEEKRQREIDERNKKAPQRIAAMEYKATELYVSYSHKWTSESPVSDKTISTVIDMIRRENDPDKRESMFDRLMSNIHFAAHKCHLNNLYKTYGERIEHRITPSHFARLLSNVELRVGEKVSVMLEHFESLEGLIHMAVQRNDTQWKEEKHEEMADEYMKQFEDH